MIKVVNKKTHKPTSDDFYIGRGSCMGNPYHHKESNHPQAMFNVNTLDECLEGYKIHLGREWISDGEIRNFMDNLVERELNDRDTNLVCYCSPNKCHGDVIKEVVEDMVYIKRFCEENEHGAN